MRSITRKEELILLSILNLKDDAYLIAIQNYLTEITGKDVSLTSVITPLNRLERGGLLKSDFGEPTKVRGGRRKKIYKITDFGFELLNEYKKINDVLWTNYPDLAEQKE